MHLAPVLEVAISLALLYLLFSQIVSSIYEMFAGYTSERGAYHYARIRKVLGVSTTKLLYDQPPIAALTPVQQRTPAEAPKYFFQRLWNQWRSNTNGLPPYIGADLFARTLLALVAPAASQAEAPLVEVKNQLDIARLKLEADRQKWLNANVGKTPDDPTIAQWRLDAYEKVALMQIKLALTRVPADTAPAAELAEYEQVKKAAEAVPTPLDGATIILLETILHGTASSASAGTPGAYAELVKNLAAWYDAYGERISGWYKKDTRWQLMLIGLLVAVAGNIDSLYVAHHFWNHSAERAVAMAKTTVAKKASAAPSPPAGTPLKPATPQQVSADLRKPRQQLDSLTRVLKEAGFPIGWVDTLKIGTPQPASPVAAGVKKTSPAPVPPVPEAYVSWLVPATSPRWWVVFCHTAKTAWLGWLVTAVALGFGAPFWFQLLSQFINMRNLGTKPAEAKK